MRIVIPHRRPDLDALASVVAACRLYDGAVGLLEGSTTRSVRRYLALHKDHFDFVHFEDIDADEVDELIIVDTRDRRRIGKATELIEAGVDVVVYDHHPSSSRDVEATRAVVEPVGACVTLLVEELREAGRELTSTEASLMLLGLYADTGRLSFASTTPRDAEAAAWLMRQKGSLRIVNRYLEDRFTGSQKSLLVETLESVENWSFDGVDIAVSVVEMEGKVPDSANVVEHVMKLSGQEALFAVITSKKSETTLIVGRSGVSYIDIGEILGKLGGGGHAGAGSASFKDVSADEIPDRLRTALEEADLEPARVSDLMSSPVHTLADDVTLEEARDCFDRWQVTGAPILRDGEIFGILSRRDIERAARGDKLELPVSSHMSGEVDTITPAEPLEEALERMTSADIGRLPVVDDGRLVGIVTRTDIIERLY